MPGPAQRGGRLAALSASLLTLSLWLSPPQPLSAQATAQSSTSDNARSEPQTWADSVIRAEGYVEPPAEIKAAVLAPRYRNVTLSNPSPDQTYFLRTESEGMPTLATYARRHYNLAGLWIDPVASRARSMTTRGSTGLSLTEWSTGRTIEVQVPEGATVSSPEWSPSGDRLAFIANFDDASHIYVATASNGRSRKLTRTPLLATFVDDYEWVNEGRSIVTVIRPDDRGPEPSPPGVPENPKVRITVAAENRLRTYADLLETPYEKDLVEYHTTGQLAVINAANGNVTKVGEPAMIRSVSASPDGQYFRVTRMVRPFSYIVPVSNFGTVEEIWDRQGNVLVTLSERPLRDGSEQGGGRGGNDDGNNDRRSVTWNPNGDGLIYLKFEPARRDSASGAAGSAGRGGRAGGGGRGGAGGQQARGTDRLVQWLPPFGEDDTRVLYESDTRMGSARFSESGEILFITEGQGSDATTSAIFLNDPGQKYVIQKPTGDDDEDAFYNDQGNLMSARGGRGGGSGVLVSSDGSSVYFQGTKYYRDPLEQAPQQFIDKVDIRTGAKTRIYTAPNDGVYERVSLPLDDDLSQLIVVRESPMQVPDSYLRDLSTGQLRKLTENVDYTPEITHAKRERVQVTRADGFSFKVDVTLPQSWQQGQRLPAIFWFYPREYTDQESYDRTNRNYNKNQFPNLGVRSMDMLVKLGYAVVEPDAPIVGDDGRMNDNYEHDLRNNLSATIDALDKAGMIDRERLAVGGHSYGAFSTANAMVNTPFFKAGIAGDGNYNRTLTPLGFQSERRDLWQAPQVYIGMSPFFQADKLTGALLMYHGMDDQNVGTNPINSERLFHALNGLGKTAALYMYPFEDHGPATQETILDLWARWTAWLDKYVKNAQPAGAKITTDASDAGMN